ncbi:MAG: D-(-)-3-hydroxybutyrate oligomer hydrolase [Pseudomonadota bacterium]|nr:D-(-)-3-hydroxybutyrate oligomer hydrolase [Pseudomonadota bacterium]
MLASGCNDGGSDAGIGALPNIRPNFIVGAISATTYNGTTDDLATGGLGKSGLAGAAPAVADPVNPTAAELRRLAIYNNYRALVDVNSPNGGYGTLFGPNIDVNGNVTASEGKIAGTEYLAYADDGTGTQNVTLMAQIPATFDPANPCIVTATSSGSRGVYGAIGTAGEWGLKHGCVVAYADKGSGSGVHDLATNTVNLINGVRQGAAAAGKNSNFTANVSASDLATFNAANPNRIAVKHAHSQQNPEKDWGRDTLRAVKFAFYELNEERGGAAASGGHVATFTPANTIVIASSVSNGGAAAIAAAEQDTEGLIDGIAVAEPVLELAPNPSLTIKRGATVIVGGGKPLYDYFTIANLYQPCAALSTRATGSPAAAFLAAASSTNRCASLKAKGLLTATTTAAQAEESLDKLIAAGWQPESNILHASHYRFAVPPVTIAYANAYGRFGVTDNLCGFSYAATDASGKPVALAAASLAQIFATFNGVGLSGGINTVNNLNPGGPLFDLVSSSPSTGGADLNLDGAICLRNLWTGSDANAIRVQNGVKETLRSANLRGKPTIIVAGRSDTLVPVNMNERPYFGQNKITEGASSKLSYIEVTNAQHFDAFIDSAAFAGYDSNFVPLHVYFIRAMDSMWALLTRNVPLPPSQVVRTVPRGGTAGAAPALTSANVPPISQTPAAGDQITFSNNVVTVPD